MIFTPNNAKYGASGVHAFKVVAMTAYLQLLGEPQIATDLLQGNIVDFPKFPSCMLHVGSTLLIAGMFKYRASRY